MAKRIMIQLLSKTDFPDARRILKSKSNDVSIWRNDNWRLGAKKPALSRLFFKIAKAISDLSRSLSCVPPTQ